MTSEMYFFSKQILREATSYSLSEFVSRYLCLACLILVIAGCGPWFFAHAEPSFRASSEMPAGGQVVSGQVVIEKNGDVMTLRQTSERAIVNWHRFDVGSQSRVNFMQPGSRASTLNRVTSGEESVINGVMSASGQVLIENPYGIVFGAQADVRAAGVMATTLRVADGDYLSGSSRLNLAGPVKGKSQRAPRIVNRGVIEVADMNSYIALMAPEVVNEGVLIAKLKGANTIALAAGQKVTLSFDGNQLADVTVDASVVNALITNKRLIYVEGGQVIIAAHSVSDLKASVINATAPLPDLAIAKIDENTSVAKNAIRVVDVPGLDRAK